MKFLRILPYLKNRTIPGKQIYKNWYMRLPVWNIDGLYNLMADNINVSVVNYNTHRKAIKQIRHQVFIQEQNVPESIESDGLDTEAKHAVAFYSENAVGTGRILMDGHLGRISVIKQYRNRGFGKAIVKALIHTAEDFPISEIWLSSQYHARGFYQKLGFIEKGTIYQEADIDHIKMIKIV